MTSEPPGEWNDNEYEQCRGDGGDEEGVEEHVINDQRQTAPLVQQQYLGVSAVMARDDTPQSCQHLLVGCAHCQLFC